MEKPETFVSGFFCGVYVKRNVGGVNIDGGNVEMNIRLKSNTGQYFVFHWDKLKKF
ncbi:MAG TPA: hypothetical protein VK175_07730 [Leadbetterella sp.]|nr:hypothetical protein [Leadbetterella sp.]